MTKEFEKWYKDNLIWMPDNSFMMFDVWDSILKFTSNDRSCESCKYQTYDDNRENCFIIDACIKNEVTLPDNFYCSEWESKQ